MLISKSVSLARYPGTFLLAWAAALFVAEGLFRLLGDKPSMDMGGLYMQFGDGGYKHRPCVDTGANWSTGPFSVHTDELGLRCDQARRMATKPGDKVDVLFMGDSQGFGNGVNFEDTIAGTVAELAAEHGYVVRNASVGGHHPPNQFGLVRWLRKAQGVKVGHYVLLLTPVTLASCDVPARARVGHDGRLYGESKDFLASARLQLKTHFVAYSRVRDALRSKRFGLKVNQATPFVFRVYQTEASDQTRQKKLVDFLQSFKTFATIHGADVQLVYVPLTLEMDFALIQRSATSRGIQVDPDEPMRVCWAAANEVNIPLHDLRPILKAFHSEGRQLNLNPDFHYTGALSRACGLQLLADLKLAAKENRSYN